MIKVLELGYKIQMVVYFEDNLLCQNDNLLCQNM